MTDIKIAYTVIAYPLLINAASSWYLSFAVTSTDGPFNIFRRLRQTLPLGGLTACIICLIFWIALVIGFLQGLTLIESIASAGIGLWLHGFTGWLYKQ